MASLKVQAGVPGFWIVTPAEREPARQVLPGGRWAPVPYRYYLVAVLAIISGFNGADRLALGVVLQDIKLDLHLNDTQLGFLTGIAFALFYSLMGIPIARWADRGQQVAVISITTALWGTAMALCAAVTGFAQLLLVRVFVAVGEAGCTPSALSLIALHFSRAERPRAVALYFQNGSLSVLIGYFAAGWFNQFFGWRITFLSLGIPGMLLSVVTWLVLRERQSSEGASRRISGGVVPGTALLSQPPSVRSELPRLKDVYKTLWGNRTFRRLLVFYSTACFFNVGIVQWLPAFLVRSYGLKTGELGTWSAAVCGLGMMVGTYVGGEWAARRAAHNESLQLKAMAVAYASVGVFSALIYLSPNRYWAFAFMGLWNVVGTTTNGPLNAMIQTLVPERMRATAMTLILLFANLIGLGLGPFAVGVLSDLLRPIAGLESLRYALLVFFPGYLWAAAYLWVASASVARDLRAVAEDTQYGESKEANTRDATSVPTREPC